MTPSSSASRSVNVLSSRVAPSRLGRRKSYSVPATSCAAPGSPLGPEPTTVRAGTVSVTESTAGVPTVRYGCMPLPNGHGPEPAFVAVVRTVSPSSPSEYSTRRASAKG